MEIVYIEGFLFTIPQTRFYSRTRPVFIGLFTMSHDAHIVSGVVRGMTDPDKNVFFSTEPEISTEVRTVGCAEAPRIGGNKF